MSDRASWWAKKLGQDQAPRAPQQPPVYTPVAQPQQYRPQQPQQQAPAHQGPMDKAAFEAALASGDPDANGGAKTQSLRNRPGCPECGSPNYSPTRGNQTDHCYECGYTSRFGPRSA